MRRMGMAALLVGLMLIGYAVADTTLAKNPARFSKTVYGAADVETEVSEAVAQPRAMSSVSEWVYSDRDWEVAMRAGDINGTAVDAETDDVLQGVEINLFLDDGTPVDVTVSDPDGRFTFAALPDSDYYMTLDYAGYRQTVIYGTVITGDITQLPPGLMIREPVLRTGSVAGRLINALTGGPLGNQDLEFRAGINTPQTEPVVYTARSGTAGYYTLTGVEAGVYTARFASPNMCEGAFTVWVQGGRDVTGQDATGTQDLLNGQLRIVLTWGAVPSDLDSHLWSPTAGCAPSPFHLYFGNRSSHSCQNYVQLDLDDVTSYGPETTTVGVSIDPVPNQVFNFLVHDYSNLSSYSSQAMSNSPGLQVQVYGGGGAGECTNTVFTMPPYTPATVWHVFQAIWDGVNWSITPMDDYCFQSSPTAVGPTC